MLKMDLFSKLLCLHVHVVGLFELLTFSTAAALPPEFTKAQLQFSSITADELPITLESQLCFQVQF